MAATVVGAHALRFPLPRQDVATTASTGDAAVAVVPVEHEAGGGEGGHALGAGAARVGGVACEEGQ